MPLSYGMHRLRRVTITHPTGEAGERFPFTVPTIRATPALEFTAPVTFLVGENGSGKSTLLEALAVKCRLATIGSVSVDRDETLVAARTLAGSMRLSWGSAGRATRGFFLRAEDFFGFTKALAEQRAALRRERAEVEASYGDRSALAKALRLGPVEGSLHELRQRYGDDFDAQSHGQAFLELFRKRFVSDGLYLLDEPEAALSPTSQLALLRMLLDMVAEAGQFVIATHSPILLALPGAVIWSFDESPPRAVRFDETEHVRVTRDFLNAPERFLRYLREP